MKAKDLSPKIIRTFASNYLSEPYVTFEQIAVRYNISSKIVSNAIRRGIAENILSTTISDAIYAKIVHSDYRCMKVRAERWDKAFAEREKFREPFQKKLALYTEFEKILNDRLENYDEYVKSTDSPLSISEINERLEKIRYAISRYNAILNWFYCGITNKLCRFSINL